MIDDDERRCGDCGTQTPDRAWNGQTWMLDKGDAHDETAVWICADGISCVQKRRFRESILGPA